MQTLLNDKNNNKKDSITEIYKILRPGEPPTYEAAQILFDGLFFNSERYDLSAVGRVKMNARLDIDVPDTVRTLRKEDILHIIKILVDLKDEKITYGNNEVSFKIDPFKKKCLMEGLDDIALSLEKSDKIKSFEDKLKIKKPWLFNDQS